MVTFMVQAMGYGFAAGTSPGPFLSFLVGTTLAYGWRRGLIVIFAPLLTDIPIILASVFLLGQLPDSALRVIQIAGGLYVLWLAWLSWKSLQAGETIGGGAEAGRISKRQTLRQAMTMNYLSPGPYIFWGTVTGPLLRQALDHSLLHAGGMLFGFYATFLVLLALWVGAFDQLRRIDPKVTRIALTITIVILAILGLVLLRNGLLYQT